MRILIADDHQLFLDVLKIYIRTINCFAEVETVNDFYAVKDKIKNSDPFDIVMLDMMMPGMNDLNSIQVFREEYPDVKLVIISGVAKQIQVKQALEMGVRGYIPKTTSAMETIEAIKIIFAGGLYVPKDEIHEAIQPSYYTDNHLTHKIPKLTLIEQDVLSYLSDGENNTFIANQLGIHLSSVKMHMRKLCHKFDAQNRTQVLLKAQDLGIV